MVTNTGDTIHKRIKQARLAVGLSQSALAKKLGIKPQSVQNWENGISSPKTTRFEKLANVLDVSPAWLLHGDERSNLLSHEVNQEELLLIKQFRRMDTTRRQVFTEIADTLADNS